MQQVCARNACRAKSPTIRMHINSPHILSAGQPTSQMTLVFRGKHFIGVRNALSVSINSTNRQSSPHTDHSQSQGLYFPVCVQSMHHVFTILLHLKASTGGSFVIRVQISYRTKLTLFPIQVFHQHLNIRICLGDAVADTIRKSVVKQCPKGLQLQLANMAMPNASPHDCDICSAKIQYTTRSLTCFDCGVDVCQECADKKRYWHRHRLFRCRFLKRAAENTHLPMVEWTCDICQKCMSSPC